MLQVLQIVGMRYVLFLLLLKLQLKILALCQVQQLNQVHLNKEFALCGQVMNENSLHCLHHFRTECFLNNIFCPKVSFCDYIIRKTFCAVPNSIIHKYFFMANATAFANKGGTALPVCTLP